MSQKQNYICDYNAFALGSTKKNKIFMLSCLRDEKCRIQVAGSPIVKMWLVDEKVFCVMQLLRGTSYRSIKYAFKKRFSMKTPDVRSVERWRMSFLARGTLLRKKGSGRPRVSLEIVQSVRDFFDAHPETSLQRASNTLEVPRSTVHKVLHEQKYRPYKIQVVQKLKTSDYSARA